MSGKVFIGAQAQQIEQTVTSILKTFVAQEFAKEPYLSRLSEWGGVNISTTARDYQEFEAEAKPIVFISIPTGSHVKSVFRYLSGGTLYIGKQHDLGVTIVPTVTERSIDAIFPLRDAVSSIFDDGYAALKTFGLFANELEPNSNSSNGGQKFDEYTLSCSVFTIPKPDEVSP